MSATEAYEHAPFRDYENLPGVYLLRHPAEGMLVTHFLTVRSIARSRAFYSEVLGGQVVQEQNPCIVKLANSWVLMNPGGPPTPDKPDISVVNYEPGNTISCPRNRGHSSLPVIRSGRRHTTGRSSTGSSPNRVASVVVRLRLPPCPPSRSILHRTPHACGLPAGWYSANHLSEASNERL